MLPSPRRWIALFSLALVLALAACGGGGQATAPTEAPPAPTEAPTRTPRPTREPTAEPEPTAISLGDGQLQPVEIGSLQTFDHPSGVFSIDVPDNWALEDNSKDGELILFWSDPTRNGALIVDIFETEDSLTQDQLVEILRTFLNNSFSSQPDFSQDEEPTPQPDDSVLIAWTYTATADNGVQAKLLGNSFIEQRGNKVSILSTLVPDDQFADLREQTNEIINTYQLNPDMAIDGSGIALGDEPAADGELQMVQFGPLVTFDHPSGVFSIDVPDNWTTQDNSKPDELIFSWTDPTRNGALIIDIFENEATLSEDELVEILRNYLNNSFGSQPDFSQDEDPTPQSDGSYLIAWTYTASADNNVQAEMLGNTFIEQRGNKVSLITILVPDAQFDDLSDNLDDLLNSYRLDPDASIQ